MENKNKLFDSADSLRPSTMKETHNSQYGAIHAAMLILNNNIKRIRLNINIVNDIVILIDIYNIPYQILISFILILS